MAKVHHLCWIWHRFPITDIVRSVGRIQKSNRDGNGKGSMLNLRGEESKETTDWSKWHYHTLSQSKYMSILLQDWSFLTSMAYLNLSWGFFTRFRHLLPLAGLLAWAHRHLKFKVTEKSRCIVAHRCSWWYARGNKKKAVIVWIPGLPMHSDKTYCTMADCTFGGWENSLSLWHCRRRCHFRCSDLACPPTATEPAV